MRISRKIQAQNDREFRSRAWQTLSSTHSQSDIKNGRIFGFFVRGVLSKTVTAKVFVQAN
jgi:hypothetical protein